MQYFIVSLFCWLGFTAFVFFLFWYTFMRGRYSVQYTPPIASNMSNKEYKQPPVESFEVNLSAFNTELPTVYSKNCAFTGIMPKGYIPGIYDWHNYSGMLP